MPGNHKIKKSKIEYVPVNEEREQVEAVIALLMEQLECAGSFGRVPTINYDQGER